MMTCNSIYEIKVQDHLEPHLLDWLEEVELIYLADGQMLIRARLPDQAALFGLLSHLYHLGVELISLNTLPQSDAQN